MAKTAKNLYLDPKVIERAEEYVRRRGTNLSRLVSEYLETLTRTLGRGEHGPLVQRLRGAGVPRAKRKKSGVEEYRSHLEKKYGRT
jgi:hypothetical protein